MPIGDGEFQELRKLVWQLQDQLRLANDRVKKCEELHESNSDRVGLLEGVVFEGSEKK